MSDTFRTRATIGTRPHTVRVVERVRPGVRGAILLEWREQGQRRRRVVPPKATKAETLAAAKADARALHQQLVTPPATTPEPPAVVTIADVYDAHVAVRGDAWRPRTRALEADTYRLWSAWASPTRDVRTLDGAALAKFRRALVDETGLVFDSAHRHAKRVQGQFRTAVDAGRLGAHPIASVRLRANQDLASAPVPEFAPDEAARLVAQLNPRQRTQWRPWALMMLAAILGPRVNALGLQRWTNLDLTPGARAIRWPAATDKTKRERWQRLPRAAVLVLRVVRVWQAREGYTGPLLFPTPRWRTRGVEAPYTYGAVWCALDEAADRAKVTRARMQAFHAFRRHAFNTVLEATGGDLVLAAEWIGDKDLSTAQRYRRRRPADGVRTVRALDAALPTPTTARANGPHVVPTNDDGAPESAPSPTTFPRR